MVFHFRLSKKETFAPVPPGQLWSGLITSSPKPLTLEILTKEEDLLWDDTLLSSKVVIPFEEKSWEQVSLTQPRFFISLSFLTHVLCHLLYPRQELKSKDGKIVIKVAFKVVRSNSW
jgi:hypothetical protein